MAKHKKRRRKVTKAQVQTTFIIGAVLFVIGIAVIFAAVLHFGGNDGGEGGTTTVATTTENTTTATTVSTTVTTAASATVKTTTAKTYTSYTALGTEGRYIQPANAAWNLKLANDWNTLPESYDNAITLVELVPGNSKSRFDSRAADALRQMLADGNAENPSLNLQIVSCYRSVARQKTLYWNEVDKWKRNGYDQTSAEIKAATVVKRPGQSEHSTGLAADLGGSGNTQLNQAFENTAAFKWLYEHCAEYGFILRFPKDKEDVTGVIYEPWHYRYVGKEVAQQIMSEGLCLEEYLEKTAQ